MVVIKIDQDNPICLYCKSNCDVASNSNQFILHFTYSCNSCKECFYLTIDYSSNDIISYSFTCYDYLINYDILYNEMSSFINEDQFIIPVFDADFSDKDKLHRKIKMCSVFS